MNENKRKSPSWELQGALPSMMGAEKAVRSVSVDEELAKNLKPHQKEGVEFIWKNCFSDCNFYDNGNPTDIGYVVFENGYWRN